MAQETSCASHGTVCDTLSSKACSPTTTFFCCSQVSLRDLNQVISNMTSQECDWRSVKELLLYDTRAEEVVCAESNMRRPRCKNVSVHRVVKWEECPTNSWPFMQPSFPAECVSSCTTRLVVLPQAYERLYARSGGRFRHALEAVPRGLLLDPLRYVSSRVWSCSFGHPATELAAPGPRVCGGLQTLVGPRKSVHDPQLVPHERPD
eukprot:15249_6